MENHRVAPSRHVNRHLSLVLRLRDKSDLLVGVLGRWDEDILGISLEDEDVVDIGVITATVAAEGPEEHDSHDPYHAEEDTDAATCDAVRKEKRKSVKIELEHTEDESDCATFPRTENHQRFVDTMEERHAMVVMTMMVSSATSSNRKDAEAAWT